MKILVLHNGEVETLLNSLERLKQNMESKNYGVLENNINKLLESVKSVIKKKAVED